MTEEHKTPKPPKPNVSLWWSSEKILGYIVVIGAFAIGRFLGWSLLIPLFFVGLTAWLGSKYLKPKARPFLIALSLMGGHLSSEILGVLVVYSGLAPSPVSFDVSLSGVFLDICLFAGGVLWLATRPGLPAVIYLTIYKGWSVVVHGWYLFTYALLASLIMQLLLDISAIAALIYGYRKFKKSFAVPQRTILPSPGGTQGV
ncbi:MAG: hypothetical protein HY597_00800 [Candidatus Omnitrophica bacterium]|nr:hypothetical protein [Candidatus Omnitrophota bacterium]